MQMSVAQIGKGNEYVQTRTDDKSSVYFVI